MGRRPLESRVPGNTYYLLLTVTTVCSVLLTGYLIARVVIVATERDYSGADLTLALLLLGAELFLAMHAAGYFFNLVKCARRQATLQPLVFAPHADATVAVLVASFNEREDVLEATLAAARALDYPAHLYLLDDSTDPQHRSGAQRVAAKYGAELVQRTIRDGYKAGAINDLIPRLSEKYIALLDADQRAHESWLKEVVPMMEERPDLALVQSPQIYMNEAGLPVCQAAKFEQAIFFEYVCEGKSYSNAMFCCGSNVVLRREALESIKTVRNGRTQYFDERSVTEDFATSFLMQMKGWSTDYVNHKYAVGMGPETLQAYFTQHMRYAMGTLWQVRHLLKALCRTPRALTPAQWWEYWMVSTYYAVGYAHFLFLVTPILFMLFDIRPVRSDSTLYLAFFVPYVMATLNLFYFGMRVRNYSVKGTWLASALSFSTFWIYMKAGAVAFLGLKRAFGVTPKGFGGVIPVRKLWMEASMLLGNVVVSLWCVYQLLSGDIRLAYFINGFWATYHAILLSTLFLYFNRPVAIRHREPLFAQAEIAA